MERSPVARRPAWPWACRTRPQRRLESWPRLEAHFGLGLPSRDGVRLGDLPSARRTCVTLAVCSPRSVQPHESPSHQLVVAPTACGGRRSPFHRRLVWSKNRARRSVWLRQVPSAQQGLGQAAWVGGEPHGVLGAGRRGRRGHLGFRRQGPACFPWTGRSHAGEPLAGR